MAVYMINPDLFNEEDDYPLQSQLVYTPSRNRGRRVQPPPSPDRPEENDVPAQVIDEEEDHEYRTCPSIKRCLRFFRIL